MLAFTHRFTLLPHANRVFVALLAALVLVWTGCDGTEDDPDNDDIVKYKAWDDFRASST